MERELDADAQSRMGIAGIAAAFAQTFRESDPDFVQRLVQHLERIYREMERLPSKPKGALELLAWTHEMLRAPDNA